MIRSAISLFSATLVALGGLTITAPAAQAVTFDHVDGYGGEVPYGDCMDFAYDWAASDDSGAAYDWEAVTTLYQPDGDYVDSVDTWGSGDYSSDSDSFTVCWADGAGTYEIEVEVTFYDEYYEVVDSGYGYGSMDITREPKPERKATRSFLRVSDRTPHYKERVTFTVKSQVRRNGAWRANRFAYVVLAGRCSTPSGDSGWVALVEGKVNRRGLGYARFIYDIPRSWRCRYASVTPRTETTKSSVSDRVRVRTSASANARVDAEQDFLAPRGAALADTGGLIELFG